MLYRRDFMTGKDKRLLLKQAAKLTILGMRVERERNRMAKLIKRGVPYNDPKMCDASERFTEVSFEWAGTEIKYKWLKKKLGMEP